MMIERTVSVELPPSAVFAYKSDPGARRTTWLSGDAGLGPTRRNVSTCMGRHSELTYAVTHHQRWAGPVAPLAAPELGGLGDGAAQRLRSVLDSPAP